jgi:hypothetical protein
MSRKAKYTLESGANWFTLTFKGSSISSWMLENPVFILQSLLKGIWNNQAISLRMRNFATRK